MFNRNNSGGIKLADKGVEHKSILWPEMHVHLVGIGGSGLSAIAEVLLGRGFVVSGSDQQLNDRTRALEAKGAKIYGGHNQNNVDSADLVLVSSAIPEDNTELLEATRQAIPTMKRAEFLGALTADNMTISVAGSHGKTTTAGMVAQILIAADLDPSFIIGGVLPMLGSNGRAGQSEYFVIEADEYDYMFLGLRSKVAVITNVEFDHPDIFPTKAVYRTAFNQFVDLIQPGGKLYICADDEGVTSLPSIRDYSRMTVDSYGIQAGSWQAKDLRTNPIGGTDFLVTHENEVIGLARLRVPGEHNVRNGLAAIAVCLELGVPFTVVRQALADFGGMGRRFEIVGQVGDVVVVDDYAHHPTEIRVTLAAARQRFPGRRIWAVWQPHTFSRTKKLQSEFTTCFADADRLVALDIFRSRETNELNIDTPAVLKSIKSPRADYLAGIEDAAVFILDRIRPGDVVLTLTAGDGNRVGEIILTELQRRLSNRQTVGQDNHLMGTGSDS
jgi:UDP-N-acetylmuramate--alanine ligase